MATSGKTGITEHINIFSAAVSDFELKVTEGKFSPISTEYQELSNLSVKINDLKSKVSTRFEPKLSDLQNRIQKLQGKTTQLSPSRDITTPRYVPRAKPVQLEKPVNQASTSYQPTKANFIFGSINQYGPTGSRSSCTSNALSFLSFAMTQANKNIKAELTSEKLNGIVENGKQKFNTTLLSRKNGLKEQHDAILKNSGESEAIKFLAEQEGDAMSPIELIESYSDSFGVPPHSPDTQTLPQNFPEKTIIFINLLTTLETHIRNHGVVGATIIANGATSSLALVSNPNGDIQYCIFDSHGAGELNGNPNAFVYVTTNKNDAACYLASLVKYIPLLDSETIANLGLSAEEQSQIFASMAQESPNQLAVSIQIPAPKIREQEGWASALISTICAVAYAIIFFPFTIWNYFFSEIPKVTPPPEPKKPDSKPVLQAPSSMDRRAIGESIFIDFYLGNT